MQEGGGDIPKPQQPDTSPAADFVAPLGPQLSQDILDQYLEQEAIVLPKPYDIQNGQVIGYEIEDEKNDRVKKKGIIMDVGTAGNDFVIWKIEDDAIGPGAQSTHPLFKPFELEGHWDETQVEQAINKFYEGKNFLDIFMQSEILTDTTKQIIAKSPAKVEKFVSDNQKSTIRRAKQALEEVQTRHVSDAEILDSWNRRVEELINKEAHAERQMRMKQQQQDQT